MLIDLHTHTDCSDGSMTPVELLDYAHHCGVDVLAITDHDTVAAFERIGARETNAPEIVTGIELSAIWQRRLVHIVGLRIQLSSEVLKDGIRQQQDARLARAEIISKRLEKLGIANPLSDVLNRAAGSPGRPHFAAHLVDIGFVVDTRTAFKRYLGAGKIGDVKESWPDMQTVIDWILASGGQPVLAHPAKYKLTTTKLRSLVTDFMHAGGVAVEVCSGSQDPATTSAIARVTQDAELLASVGSDFHHRSQSWSQPGRYARLPASVTPIWETW